MRLPAEGTDVSLGPRSCRRAGCPGRCGTDAAAGWSLRTSGLMSWTRYVLRPAHTPVLESERGAADAAAGARSGDPLWFLPSALSPSNLQLDSGWDTLDGLQEAVAPTWSGQPGPRGGLAPGQTRELHRSAVRAAGAGTSAPFALYCPWRVSPELGGGVWSTRKSPFFSLGPRFPVKLRETHLLVSQPAERDGA